MNLPFANREEAGVELADLLERRMIGTADTIVLALPRGGVPVAAKVAEKLDADLDVLIVRKLGLPGQPELAMGAIASGGVRVMNADVLGFSGVSSAEIETVVAREQAELERRLKSYRGARPLPSLRDRRVILVDDGIATGATMFAAIEVLRGQKPAEIIVAVPVAPPDTVLRLQDRVDEVVCLAIPSAFFGVGQWYRDFSQTTDAQVRELLDRAWRCRSARAAMTQPNLAAPAGELRQ
jgi:putative phosphoribosyl transferase